MIHLLQCVRDTFHAAVQSLLLQHPTQTVLRVSMLSQLQLYLVESELSISCVTLLKLLVPVAFEVDGVDQNQPAHGVHHTRGQNVLNFTWGAKMTLT